jgi:hypothetical protein
MSRTIVTITLMALSFLAGVAYIQYNMNVSTMYEDGSYRGCVRGGICEDIGV